MWERMQVASSGHHNYSTEEDAVPGTLGGDSDAPDESMKYGQGTAANVLDTFCYCASEPTEECSPVSSPDKFPNGLVSAGSRVHATMGSGSCPRHVRAKLDRGADQRKCGNPNVQNMQATSVCADGGGYDGFGATMDSLEDETAEIAATPLGVRHADTLIEASSASMSRPLRVTLKRHAYGSTGSDCVTTSVVVHDPFATTTRKQQTIDTVEYLRWARTSSIIHEVR